MFYQVESLLCEAKNYNHGDLVLKLGRLRADMFMQTRAWQRLFFSSTQKFDMAGLEFTETLIGRRQHDNVCLSQTDFCLVMYIKSLAHVCVNVA